VDWVICFQQTNLLTICQPVRFTRVTLFFIAFIIALGFYQLARHFLAEVEPQTFQATEEVMVDAAHLFAEIAATDDREPLRKAFNAAHQRKFEARIYEHLKKNIGIHVYLTDENGVVLFDSDDGRREGLDYSEKLDVARTLRGEYGARSSREVQSDNDSSVLYVAAPVGDSKNPQGVLTVYKPQMDVLPLVRERRRIIYVACGLIGSGILFLITAVFLWLFRPIGQITDYARAIERGERPPKPKIGIGREVNTLARALDGMRDALEGRKYAEHYIHTLTHEMKSPLAAIRGAAELLEEDMPREDRRKFIENIRAESARTERLINRLLELAAIESRAALENTEEINLVDVVRQAVDQVEPLADVARVRLQLALPEFNIRVRGDAFILRAAVTNLLENAVDFSPADHPVEVSLLANESAVELRVRDHGPGIPEYARDRIFERFYSLRHHSSGRKGTGLGLTLVREAAELHGGEIDLVAAEGSGTIAILKLPML